MITGVLENRIARDAHNKMATAENENQNPGDNTDRGSITKIISAAKLSVCSKWVCLRNKTMTKKQLSIINARRVDSEKPATMA